MTPRRKRMVSVALMVAGVGVAAAFALQAFQQNLLYFYNPIAGACRRGAAGPRCSASAAWSSRAACVREPGSLEVRFTLTDFATALAVSYTGVLPDLFREGQGIIARGRLAPDGLFVAEEVLAKHDENYMPPEVKESLKPHVDARSRRGAGE